MVGENNPQNDKSELVEMEQARRIDKERIRQLESGMAALDQNIKAVSPGLKLNPSVKEIKRAIVRNTLKT